MGVGGKTPPRALTEDVPRRGYQFVEILDGNRRAVQAGLALPSALASAGKRPRGPGWPWGVCFFLGEGNSWSRVEKVWSDEELMEFEQFPD